REARVINPAAQAKSPLPPRSSETTAAQDNRPARFHTTKTLSQRARQRREAPQSPHADSSRGRQDSSQAKDRPYDSPSALSIPRKCLDSLGPRASGNRARHFVLEDRWVVWIRFGAA